MPSSCREDSLGGMRDHHPIQLSIITVVKDDLSGIMFTAERIVPYLYPPVEWVIIDGSNAADSQRYMDELAERACVKVYRLAPKGIYDAMNHGLSSASGLWCWFLNAGDAPFSSNSISRAVELTKRNTEVGVIGSTVVYFLENYMFSCAVPKSGDLPSPEKSNFHHQGSIIKRAALLELGGFRLDLNLTSDGEAIDRLLSNYPSTSTIEPLASFSIGGASTRQFRTALSETNTFRPNHYGLLSRKKLQTKNLFLKIILSCESKPILSSIVRPYLRWRDSRVRAQVRNFQFVTLDLNRN